MRVSFFSAPAPDQTFAGIGELTMSPADWQAWRDFLRVVAHGSEYFSEDADGMIELTIANTVDAPIPLNEVKGAR